ncbi:2-methylcitrate dehydratase [Limnochorda pilosa]|uniref:2-methylcitrate dehydratase n=1 Tax=Limnochorda pilosa TaxID=1555112 RepID=A0A0K2SH55_LIMPI|nr:2-methylcitrate dehydratase [Limnochorda pilosa]
MLTRATGPGGGGRTSLSEILADFVARTRFDDLPGAVVHEVRRSFLNWLGVTLGAAREEAVRIAARVLAQADPAPQATVVGHRRRLDCAAAALVNGLAAHLYDFDDTHARSILHPSAPIFPTCLALSEHLDLPGEAFITAYVVGSEVADRIAAAVTPWHNEAGWHVTGTVGTFGAAAAASKLLGLSTAQAVHALGLAATQAAGLREMFGSMAKPLHPGKAAWNGLLAASLAREGFTSSLQGLEGRRGFLAVMTPGSNPDALTHDLGRDFEMVKNRYKPYACGVVTHAAIDAAIEARRRGIEAAQVERVEAFVHPLVQELTGKAEPQTGLEGKFSVSHCIAVGLIDGRAGPGAFTDARVRSHDAAELRRKVQLVVDPDMGEEAARLVVRTVDGRQETITVDLATGSLERPMSDRALEEKFRMLVEASVGRERTQALIDAVWSLGAGASMRDLARSIPVVEEP